MITAPSPRLYVGTFAKYNSGSIKGDWIDLEGHDKDSFLEACRDLHSDESDPEFMFQDFEGFPKSFYSECHLSESLFEFLALSEEERELIEACADATGDDVENIALSDAQDVYAGEFESVEEFSESLFQEMGELESVSNTLRYCIDWEVVWNSSLQHDYVHTDHRNGNGNLVFFRR